MIILEQVNSLPFLTIVVPLKTEVYHHLPKSIKEIYFLHIQGT
jgi:hypothetical protein